MNKVHGLDIRSQYAFSSTLNLPAGPPVILTTLNSDRIPDKPIIDIVSFCKHLQKNQAPKTVQVINSTDFLYKEEYYAVQNWLKKRVFDQEVLQNKYSLELCYSATTPMGQLNFNRQFVDCYVLLTKGIQKKILLFQYHGFYHGCAMHCTVKDPNSPENIARRQISEDKDKKLQDYANVWQACTPNLTIEIVIAYPCDVKHTRIDDVPRLLTDIVPKHQSYNRFLSKVNAKQYEGFLVVKNLKLKNENCVPSMGFCVQRSTIEPKTMYSSYMKDNYNEGKKTTAVLGLNEFKHIKVLHTHYYHYLKEHFGFECEPLILHAVLFKHDAYLKQDVEHHLELRANIKEQLKNPNLSESERRVLNSESSSAKLKLNGTYGFTLLKEGNQVINTIFLGI